MIKIAYLGPRGTFSEEAAKKFVERNKIAGVDFVPVNTIDEVVDMVKVGHTHLAIVPIQNSMEGVINLTLDKFIVENGSDFYIVSEVELKVKHNLLVVPGAKLSDIKEIFSHPQAEAQCRATIKALLPERPIINLTNSTSKGAEVVAQKKDKTWAAIGSMEAARIYGLKVLKKSTHDNKRNTTRFMVIGKTAMQNKNIGKYKTALMFTVKNKSGALLRVMEVFDALDINMIHLALRPSKKYHNKCVFFVEIEGHQEDSDVAVAVEKITTKADYVRVLGSYPVWAELGKK